MALPVRMAPERLRPSALLSLGFSIAGIVLILWSGWQFLDWAVINGVWLADSHDGCRPDGACWAVLLDRHGLIFFGLFPEAERWRPAAAILAFIVFLSAVQFRAMWTLRRLITASLVFCTIFLGLMYGGFADMQFTMTNVWGGLALTLFLYLVGLFVSLPMGMILALMRRSRIGWLSWISALVVDGVRTLPMVMVLFSIAIIAPMFLPDMFAGDKLWRVALAFGFVYACYQAEVFRAGIQAVPQGQVDAAKAIALNSYQRFRLVVLPQALANSFPSMVNLLVLMFKETSLVAVIGFFDFTASAQAAYGNAEWARAYTEVYVFIAIVYFVSATSISLLGEKINKKISGVRR